METANNYLKQLGVWGTALRERYASDLYFRTSVNIIALQAGFVLVSFAGFILALALPAQGWIIFGLVLLVAIGFGALLARFTLRPARDTLRYQKLFISNVAHELRTPLSTIKTSSEVALLDDKLGSPARKTFIEIIEELNRVSEIINNLLSLNTLTRPERMQFHNVDLGPLAEAVVKRHMPLARERGIRLVLKKEAGSVAYGNATALEQIMANLVKNALSYTPENTSGNVTVTLRPDQPAAPGGVPMVLFAVADSGIGISQEDLYHIFEPFYRADTSRVRKVKKTGSGLGLTIVNEMVRAHHGKIHVQSTRRKGTIVSVYLQRGGYLPQHSPTAPQGEHSEASIDFTAGSPQGIKPSLR